MGFVHTATCYMLFVFLLPGSDYLESSIPPNVEIPAGTREGCFNVSIIDDDENELQEDFRITARLPSSLTDDAVATVVINDNDGKMSFGKFVVRCIHSLKYCLCRS